MFLFVNHIYCYDVVQMQLISRYLLLCVFLWIVVYASASLLAGIYGRWSNAAIMNWLFDTRSYRVIWLQDAFGLRELNTTWIWYKRIASAVLVLLGFIFIIVGAAAKEGFLWFAGGAMVLYYLCVLTLVLKPEGLHYLVCTCFCCVCVCVFMECKTIFENIDTHVMTGDRESRHLARK